MEILSTIISLFIGGGITWFFSELYNKKASKELLEETKTLRESTWIIIRTLEENGLIEVEYEKGKPKGIKITTIHDTKVKNNNKN